ncbi:MAG: hypothetical protein H6719_29430 [Sandaracinaceae bacterium]|nr:hypothetical protein [Sandaracinaceae bacterium]
MTTTCPRCSTPVSMPTGGGAPFCAPCGVFLDVPRGVTPELPIDLASHGIELVEQRGVAGYREGHGTTSRFTVSWARPRMLVEAVVLTVVFVGFLVYASRATDLGLFFGWFVFVWANGLGSLARAALNTTTVTVDRDEVDARTGPLAWRRHARVARAQIQGVVVRPPRFFGLREGRRPQRLRVVLQTTDGDVTVGPPCSPEKAEALAGALRAALAK